MKAIFKIKVRSHDLEIDTSKYSERELKELLLQEIIENIKNYDLEKALKRNPEDYITFKMENPSLESPKSKIPII